jgi:uncharacterized protein (TIGR00255 family)
MPNSMTAFAREQIQTAWGNLVCEIRTVNHRYLETTVRLPDQIRAAEMPMRDVVRAQLTRGKVEVNFRLQFETNQLPDIEINQDRLQQVIAAADAVKNKSASSSILNALQVLQWPGVIAQNEIDESAIQKTALTLLTETLKSIIATRKREGDELKQYIEQRLAIVFQQEQVVRNVMPELLAQRKQRVQQKFAELQVQLDTERLEQEMILYINKNDVDEELDRLKTHVTEVQRVLSSSGAIGRRLDFLMQELNREANTLASKSIATEITQAAVELKVAIEQMREQIQNIE